MEWSDGGRGSEGGGRVWCDGGGEAVVGTHISSPRFHCRLHTWAVGGRTCGGDHARAACRAGGMVATLPMATWPLQYSVKGRRGGKRYDPPAYADSDDGKHRHHLDDMARCHVIACTRFLVLGVCCCHCGRPVMVVGGSC